MSSTATTSVEGDFQAGLAELPTRLVAVMFTDLVDSTRLKSILSAAEYVDTLAWHDRLLRKSIKIANGRLQQDTGDGGYAIFESASDATRAALFFQWSMHFDTTGRSSDQPVAARVGIHLGEVAVADGEFQQEGGSKLVGLTVDLASRVMSLAGPGQILLTRDAFNNARQFVEGHPRPGDGSPPPVIQWLAHGPYSFKGADEPLEVFEVGAAGIGPLAAPPDSKNARRFLAPGDEQTLGWRPAVGRPMENQPNWSISKKLGEGGFGEVWLAEQKKTGASRVYKFCFDAERLRAMKREVVLFRLLKDALGTRPDIAIIRDWQFDAAPYYIELEYMPDGNLVEWSEAQGGIAAVPLADRLEIVRKIAEALAAAHSIGILHKDIKPSNILMHRDEHGVVHPLLADFGIGMLTDRSKLHAHHITEMTAFDKSIVGSQSSPTGTRMYLPPESLARKPYTIQGDIFALGVVLYQMVAGDLSRPLAMGWERDVPDELLREDIAHAVEGIPSRRLASVTELASGLATLEARRTARAAAARAAADAQNALEQAARFELIAARRKRLLTAAVSLIVLLAGVVGVILLLAHKLNAETHKAQENERIAHDQTAAANDQRRQALNAKALSDDMSNAFTSIIVLARSDQNLTILRAVTEVERNLDEQQKNIDVRDRLRVALGKALNELGKYDEALAVLRRVSSGARARADLVTADLYEQYAAALSGTDAFGKTEEVYGYQTEALAIRRRLQPPDAPEIINLQVNIAGQTAFESSMSKGEETFLLTMQPYFGNRPPQEMRAWMVAQSEQAKYLMEKGQMSQAVDLFRILLKPLLDNPATRREVPDGVGMLGLFVLRRGDVEGGEALGRVAAQLSGEINGEDDPLHARDVFELGRYLVDKAAKTKGQEGTVFMRQAVDIARRKLGPTNNTTIEYAATLAASLRLLGKAADADQVRAELLAGAPSDPAEGAQARAKMLSQLAYDVATKDAGNAADLQQAQTDALQAVDEAEKGFGTEDKYNDFFYISMNLETVLRVEHKFADAKKVCDKWLPIMINKYGAVDRHVGTVQNRLGQALLGLGQTADAVKMLQQAFNTLDTSGATPEVVVQSLLDVANAQDSSGDTLAADATYRMYLNRCQLRYGDDSPETLEAMRVLAQKLARHPSTRPEACDLLVKALKQSSRLLGNQSELTARIQQTASECGVQPTTAPVVPPARAT